MRAVDTNVVVRLIVDDDPDQTGLAESELEKGFFLSHGVLMEAEWVLRSFYRLARDEIGGALRQLLNHADVIVPELESVHWALDRYLDGADLPDMLHLIAAAPYGEFASFEKHLAKRAGPDAPVRVVHLR